MSSARYVILNPSGNLTALVTEWPGPEREPEITAALMRESEQVAYLEPPVLPESLGRIRLMGEGAPSRRNPDRPGGGLRCPGAGPV